MLKVDTSKISLQQIEAFEQDGVICVKNVLDDIWVERIRTAVDRNVLIPGPLEAKGIPRPAGRVEHTSSLWLTDADFRALAFESPLAKLAAQVLKSEKLNFLSDGFFVKKPKVNSRVGWHNDLPYWPIQGWQCCKIWLALDSANQENGRLEYIKASHQWGKELREGANPSWFVEPEPHEILSWDMEPGDCLVHHFLTIHHSVTNISSTQRRAVVTNWTGDDVTYYHRPKAWPFRPLEEIDLPEFNSFKAKKPGEPIDCDMFPRVEVHR
ncbi:MAG: phytanoyl-CoA dioxygenase family protein [Nostoc sp.]|uniref:phytanoyl-CoA dioxygenase family protein n=1 Tax=unclassified Nostoc TaxID=2593658 RepID=UPI001D7A5B99|nr:phytanoyl-CoA dioxygenase family protein [Nostoc sp. JL23]MBN3876536.1 phytanoyl-CoA dioxygenase family protein [Nostoc sp. JL23]